MVPYNTLRVYLKDGGHGLNGPYHSTQFWRRRTKLLFLWRVDMNFLSQIIPERSAHRDGFYLFSDFRDNFREGDIGDLSTLHKNNSFVRRLQNCVEWYGPFNPWHPSFKYTLRNAYVTLTKGGIESYLTLMCIIMFNSIFVFLCSLRVCATRPVQKQWPQSRR